MEKKRRDVVVVLPDIRSTHNTGAFFRTGDAAGIKKIYLTGITASPPHPHLIKVSLGAEQSVPWEYVEFAQEVVDKLRSDGFQIVAVEQIVNSEDFKQAKYTDRVALIFGNEVEGLAQELVKNADMVVDIPMRGKKESLNVSVAGGILLYHLL